MSEIGQKLISERNYSILIAVPAREYASFLVVDFSSLICISSMMLSMTFHDGHFSWSWKKRTFLRFTNLSGSRHSRRQVIVRVIRILRHTSRVTIFYRSFIFCNSHTRRTFPIPRWNLATLSVTKWTSSFRTRCRFFYAATLPRKL